MAFSKTPFGRAFPVAGFLIVVAARLVCGQSGGTETPQFDPLCTDEMRADARLHDVCFVSSLAGWAVGDRGTIWHTSDGGQQWNLQSSGVSCPLYCVSFLNERVGWAAGGFAQPYRHGSAGVILATGDGGRTWQPASKAMLPAVRKLRFHDAKFGYALGDASSMYPSGAFVTETGGLDWQPVHGDHPLGWTTGDMTEPNTGALAGRLGASAAVRRRTINRQRSPDLGSGTLRALQLVPNGYGWLVGDGAMVLLTGDWGITWQSTPGAIADGIPGNFDFFALAVRGARCWVAGTPGTRVLRTDDAGKSWTALSTGQNAPIHAMTFVDDQNGWAVGALGTILATSDGGQTWRRQRVGGTRAALLGVFSGPEDIPLEMLVQLSGNDGYLSVVEVVNDHGREAAPRRGAPLEARLREAVVRLGASDARLAWRFPVPPAGWELGEQAVLDGWNQANDGRGMERLAAHLVRSIRLWRPEVVVTHAPSPTGDDPCRHLINQAVLDAVERAADPTSFVDQITGAGLEPWRVKKVYAVSPSGIDAKLTLSDATIADRLGQSLGEAAVDARGLIEERFTPGPETLGFRLMVDRIDEGGSQDDFFARIALPPGGEARRAVTAMSSEGVGSRAELAQRNRNVRAILRRSEADAMGGRNLLAKAGELTRGMDAASAGRVLYHLARQYHQRGEWPLAAETFETLVDRCPNDPLSGEALVWLVQYYASIEAAWRAMGTQRTVTQSVGRPSQSTLSLDPTLLEDRPAKAAEFARRLRLMRPELAAEPEIGFPLAVADRMRGLPGQAERFLLTQRRRETQDAWWSCAQGEGWLAAPSGAPPKPVLRCARAAAKPKLDGKLDDPVWQAAPAAVMRGQQDDQNRPASLKMAYDEEYLYFAIECRREPGIAYAETPGSRPRDADLSGRDRVDILLDLDRDFVTFYRLAVDHRGWTADECWGDRSWNPAWFVAHAVDDETWTIEAAIPLDQLTGRYPRPGDAWALGSQRVIPGVGFQSWNAPASPRVVPEGLGYLMFQ
ncbi:MAG: hypothetical protein GX621_14805 [Pirellulaceae bacterium]|nr:hypothetical protein [Pirellulaceae bacterium]